MASEEAENRVLMDTMNGAIQQNDELNNLSLEELLYSSASFHAISVPVSLTMIMTALSVIFINTEETLAQGEQALSDAYEVFDNSSTSSTAATLGFSLLNALIIVSVICAMTFGIVLLYKYRCLKCLLGYMMFSSAGLLGFLGGTMFQVAINKYHLAVDNFSFYFSMANFAIVGVIAIFWQQGIPAWITQGYLICTSTILAWQLSHFDPWTSWTLLVMLALYDLCAVLTPCGPLKALVNLMQQEGSPDMPGLLYEVQLPFEARRPSRRRTPSASPHHSAGVSEEPSPGSTEDPVTMSPHASGEEGRSGRVNLTNSPTVTTELSSNDEAPVEATLAQAPRARIPLAIARLYRLQFEEEIEPLPPTLTPLLEEDENTNDNRNGTPNATAARLQYSPEQLKSRVTAIFPRGGGRIEQGRNADGATRYAVRDRHDNIVRILFVDDEGRVLEESRRDQDDDDDPGKNTIKLGLGDFIFYSVLVANAVLYSFTTFAACMLVILAGLGGTLVLLAVYKHALPALPISIFLGVLFFILTRALIEPWIEVILKQPFYV